MADEVDSKSIGGDTVRVQVPQPALLGRGKGTFVSIGRPVVTEVLFTYRNEKVFREVRAVTCKEAERMVTPYIKDELDGDELEAFLAHLENCPSCQEELEIYFMVDVGLKQLDKDSGTFDIIGALQRRIEESYYRVRMMWAFRAIRYALNTLGIMAVMVTILLQFRIWLVG